MKSRGRLPILSVIVAVVFTCVCLSMVTSMFFDLQPNTGLEPKIEGLATVLISDATPEPFKSNISWEASSGRKSCFTVEEMGETMKRGIWKETLRVRRIIEHHFTLNGASRVRELPPEQFCSHGFVLGKASEAGFGNEIYKILNAAVLSILLNRSLIIGQTRGKFPFGDYIRYSDASFTLKEVKHLWRKNCCVEKHERHLVMRIDDFEKPKQTRVLCGNWRHWKQPIIWFQNTRDAVPCQFFLKNVHSEMRQAASDLFGAPDDAESRPNIFGELMRFIVSPSKFVDETVNWTIAGGREPDISLHMRMFSHGSVRAMRAAVNCIRKAVTSLQQTKRPRVVLVSDTPSLVDSILPEISGFAEVLHFDFEHFRGNISPSTIPTVDFRVKDWGPAPRWVAFVDFFLASRARHAVISGAFRRVGTTYAQLIAALAGANNLGDDSAIMNFSFLSSFQSNLLKQGLELQSGWGHVWNRFGGPLSCAGQSDQCAFTPLLPLAWWDGLRQSPISQDIRRLMAFGIKLSPLGAIDEDHLRSFCSSRKISMNIITIL